MSDINKFNEQYENDQECADCEIHYLSEQTGNSSEQTGKWALRDRLRSKVLWAGVISQISTIVFTVYQWIKYGITPNSVEVVAMAILSILTIFGVLNDPTNKEGF